MVPTIYERVHARADLDQMRATRDITGLAAALNAEGLYIRQPRFITARAVLTVNPTEGRNILRALRTAAAQDIGVEFANLFLGQSAGVDIGDPDMWVELDHLVQAGALNDAQAALLKALSLALLVVTQEQVAAELYYPDGTEK
jgi:hypothetical protein